MKMGISEKENALRALNFEVADHIPIQGGWIKHAKFLEKASGISLKYGFAIHTWENPLRAAVQAYRNVGAGLIFMMVLPEKQEEITIDGFRKFPGLHTNIDSRYRTPEDILTKFVEVLPHSQDLRSTFDFETEYFNRADFLLSSQEELGDSMLWMPTADTCRFMWWMTFGYRNYLTAIVRYKRQMLKLFEYSAEECRLKNEVLAKVILEHNLPPFVWLGQDVCDNHGPMVSPKILDEIYFPNLKKSIEPLQKAGIKTIWHCDGNITPILDRFIDLGADGFQGFEEEQGVDFPKILNMKTKNGKDLVIFGSISVKTTLPFGTVENVRKDVERCMDLAEGRSGFVLCPANVAGREVPVENIFAMYEHARKYGKGK